MNETTQDELRGIISSRYNFQVVSENVYRIFFVKKVYTYFHEDYDTFLEKKDVMLYCAQHNPETGRLRKNGVLFQLPMKERKFIVQWTVANWLTFLHLVRAIDKITSELEQITEALKNSPAGSKDLKKLAKERTRKLKNDLKTCDRKLNEFYIDVRNNVLEKAVFK